MDDAASREIKQTSGKDCHLGSGRSVIGRRSHDKSHTSSAADYTFFRMEHFNLPLKQT